MAPIASSATGVKWTSITLLKPLNNLPSLGMNVPTNAFSKIEISEDNSTSFEETLRKSCSCTVGFSLILLTVNNGLILGLSCERIALLSRAVVSLSFNVVMIFAGMLLKIVSIPADAYVGLTCIVLVAVPRVKSTLYVIVLLAIAEAFAKETFVITTSGELTLNDSVFTTIGAGILKSLISTITFASVSESNFCWLNVDW